MAEFLAAHLAIGWLILFVKVSHMFLQISTLNTPKVTMWTAEWFVTGVDSLMIP